MGAKRILPNGAYVDGTYPTYIHTPVAPGTPGHTIVIRTDGNCTVVDDNRISQIVTYCNGRVSGQDIVSNNSISSIKILNGVAAQDELKNEAIIRTIPKKVLEQIKALAKSNDVTFTFEEVISTQSPAITRTPSVTRR